MVGEVLTIEQLEPMLCSARRELDNAAFEQHLRHARHQIAHDRHVRAWSLFAIKWIARRCLHDPTDVAGNQAALVREAELLLAGVMSDQVDPELFYAGGLLSYIKLQRASDEEKAILARRTRALLEAALAATLVPNPELLLDFQMLDRYQAHDLAPGYIV